MHDEETGESKVKILRVHSVVEADRDLDLDDEAGSGRLPKFTRTHQGHALSYSRSY